MRRRRRRGDDAQAILETALVIPVLLLLVCNFIALMVQIAVQQQLNAATALAAESRFQSPNGAIDPAGARCCTTRPGDAGLSTAGVPTGCRYAAETFYGTIDVYAHFLVWQTAPLCMSGGDSGSGSNPAREPVAYPGSPSGSDVSCVIGSVAANGTTIRGYLDRTLNPPGGLYVVTCSAVARLDFSRTPLGWGVLWSPTLHAHAEALPPPFRQ